MALNCINFEYDSCNFSKKHMTSKDRMEEKTKEGCGRVNIHKICGIVHSYTLECGFHCSNYLNDLAYASNIHRKIGNYGYTEDETENVNSEFYKKNHLYYTPEVFENIGKVIFISILETFDKNPYSRILNT